MFTKIYFATVVSTLVVLNVVEMSDYNRFRVDTWVAYKLGRRNSKLSRHALTWYDTKYPMEF